MKARRSTPQDRQRRAHQHRHRDACKQEEGEHEDRHDLSIRNNLYSRRRTRTAESTLRARAIRSSKQKKKTSSIRIDFALGRGEDSTAPLIYQKSAQVF